MEDKDTQKNLNSNNQNSSVEQNSTGVGLGAEKTELQTANSVGGVNVGSVDGVEKGMESPPANMQTALPSGTPSTAQTTPTAKPLQTATSTTSGIAENVNNAIISENAGAGNVNDQNVLNSGNVGNNESTGSVNAQNAGALGVTQGQVVGAGNVTAEMNSGVNTGANNNLMTASGTFGNLTAVGSSGVSSVNNGETTSASVTQSQNGTSGNIQNVNTGDINAQNGAGVESVGGAETLESGTGTSVETGETATEPKKSKFKFPGKMGTVAGPTATISEIEKLENDASKESKKKKGKKGATEDEEKPKNETTDNGTSNDEIEEEVEEEIVEEEVEEEVEDETSGENVGQSTENEKSTNIETAETTTERNSETTETTAETAGDTAKAVADETGVTTDTAITGVFGETEEERNKRIEEDEKRKSKFVLFPKKTSGTGAVNGAGFDKEKIKDKNRSVRFRPGKSEQTEADIENEIKKPKPLWLKITIAVVSVIIGCGAIFGAYLGYLQSGHNRVYDWKYLQIVNKNKNNTVMLNTTLDCITYNMSYGIMDPDFTYYKAENKMANGSSTKGGSSRATNKDRVIINANGSAELVGKGVNSSVDFILFQDIDVDSTRSYYVDQKEILTNSLSSMAGVFAETGSSNYVVSPISSPLGRTDSRMATFSDKYISFRIRYSLPSNSEFMTKYGTNDNCVILTRFKTTGSSMLSIINVNVGIYEDEDIRQKDLEALLKIMDYELNTKGNYCLVGGSFGYLLNGTDGEFLNNMQSPSWSKNLPDTFNADVLNGIGYSIARDEVAIDQNIGTVRDMSVSYSKGGSFEAIVDGFIVSKNISVDNVSVIDNGYLYSSHNPVKISFRLLR